MRGTIIINFITVSFVFTYAVLYSSLSLYLTEKAGLSIVESNSIVGIFIAFNFLLHLFAGYIGGRFISNKSLLAVALLSQLVGGSIITYAPLEFLITGLSFFLVGSGFGTTCINCLLTQQFEHDNADRREKAFFYNYSSLNFGFFLGLLSSGYFYSFGSFKILFQVGFLINITSFLIFVICQKNIKQTQVVRTDSSILRLKFLGAIYITAIFVGVRLGFYYERFTNLLVLSFGLVAIIYVGLKANKICERTEKYKIYCFFIFIFAAIVFWTLYFIGPMGFIFFLKYNVHHEIFGYQISPQWFMNLDSMLVIVGGPLLSSYFQHLRKKSINIPIANKFTLALLMISCSCFILRQGILHADVYGFVGIGWVAIYYIFQAMGELLIAPVGYAMIGRLAPESLQGIMMGIWMMVSGVASVLSHLVSNAMFIFTSNSPIVTNINYLLVFRNLGVYALIAGVILFLFSKKINTITEDKKTAINKTNIKLELINEQ